MYKIQRKLFSQNFLHSRKIASHLIGRSSIGKNDLVIEIGPGKGILTEQLIKHAGHVFGVEIDARWCTYLREKFRDAHTFTLYQADILSYSLPAYPYKVFANIPFSIEGKIIRKLIDDAHPPQDCYLVVMKEFAYRLCGKYGGNMFTIMHKPWFDFSIVYTFRKTDFEPVPNVDAVLFRFTMKKVSLLPIAEKERYMRFIMDGFRNGEPVYKNLMKKYGHEKIERVFQLLSLNRRTKPSFLTLKQWIALHEKVTLMWAVQGLSLWPR